jgi:hypothetical protein
MGSLCTILALAGAVVHFFLSKQPRTPRRAVELLLVYSLVFLAGAGGLIAFMGHTFKADDIARGIGWPTGSPFQSEVAFANLSYAVVAFLSIWLRGLFPAAAGLSYCVFLFGAAHVHIREMHLHANYCPFNSGVFLYVQDILVPAIIIVLIVGYLFALKKERQAAKP